MRSWGSVLDREERSFWVIHALPFSLCDRGDAGGYSNLERTASVSKLKLGCSKELLPLDVVNQWIQMKRVYHQ